MNNSSLSELKPNRIPPMEFELAPGWIILAVMALISAIYILIFTLKYYRNNCYRRQALKQLKIIKIQWQKSHALSGLKELPLILKTAAFNVDPKSASLSGESWLKFLQLQCPKMSMNSFIILNKLNYSPNTYADKLTKEQVSNIFGDLESWLCLHRKMELCL
ncbi:DUF4381 domain-containing protein [Lentisphaera profundi]|uniref:DUF4381 domain-containing protein n=1 Tax=Lentisphaera profundi TaxID=1658616 RepID=A0ABY7VSK9_9BACT|nr:DUF4381 domain-containing protein [Lentisphaera profundi]WDE96205.1 DUF4381 domain-containing protein [Lentisphaera profundi]